MVEIQYVMLVDDDIMIRRTFTHVICSYCKNVEVETFADGILAKERISQIKLGQVAPVSLILSDICMPIMNGLELAIFADNEVPQIPLVLMTGYSSQVKVENNILYHKDVVLTENVKDYIKKPILMSQFSQMLSRYLQMR